MIIDQVFESLLQEKELTQDPIAFATIKALKEFVDNGGKLSELPWLKGLNFELLEAERVSAVA